MKKLSFLAVILALALLLSGCGVEYVNQFADIPKPEAVFTLDVDGVVYYMRFTLDPAAAPNTVCNFISLANGGYYDFGFAPQLSLWPEMANAAIIELKYIKAGEAAPTPEKLEAMRQEASAQLDCYAKDQNLAQEWRLKPGNGTPGIEGGTVTLHRIILAFHGGNCVLCEKLP
ncbi:MAG: hypothetical protein IKS78_00565 [Clostridia bacterium]|nr:hypothetical protein [Clostridia bacterium]